VPEVVEFLGLHFHCDTLRDGAIAIVEQSRADRFCYVVTPNVQHVVTIARDRENLGPLIAGAWRVYCDSRVLSRLAWLCRKALPVVTGSDLTGELLRIADAAGGKISVIGPSTEDCARLRIRYPRLEVACHTPPIGFMEREPDIASCIEFVRRERAPLVFLALGMPRQEMLAARLARERDLVGVGLCVGASIDFLTGRQRRAPLWMQRAGLEWLHRLIADPVRLGPRYLIECPRVVPLVLRELAGRPARARARRPGAGCGSGSDSDRGA
jgi:exopolysaccharide biosynthesis WecB/TagA/CpsF family protein